MFERVLKLRGIKILQNSVYSNKHKIQKKKLRTADVLKYAKTQRDKIYFKFNLFKPAKSVFFEDLLMFRRMQKTQRDHIYQKFNSFRTIHNFRKKHFLRMQKKFLQNFIFSKK